MDNPFVQVELMSNDIGQAKTFLKSVFDWKLDDMPVSGMTYTMIRVGEGTGAAE
jgi:predicted enzyme related to lactoylglutathione lyase